MSDDFNERLTRIEQIAAVVAQFDTPELKLEVYRYLVGTPNVPPVQPEARPAKAKKAATPPAPSGPGSGTGGTVKKKSSSSKQTFGFDKDIDFYATSGNTSTTFKTFVEQHHPKNAIHKVVLAVHWLTRELNVPEATIDQVYTAFKTMGWVVPADLANTIQQAGSKNFLDSKNRLDLKVTTHGENLVDHELKPATDS